jgi:hypothetical protein
MNWEGCGRKRSWTNRGIILRFSWRDWVNTKKVLRLAGVPNETRTEHPYTNLFDGKHVWFEGDNHYTPLLRSVISLIKRHIIIYSIFMLGPIGGYYQNILVKRDKGVTTTQCTFCSQYSHWLLAGRPWGRSSSLGGGKNFHFSMSSRPALGPTQPPIQRVSVWGLFPRE